MAQETFIYDDKKTNNMKDPANDIRNYFKRWPRFYYFIVTFFGPVWWTGLSEKGFLKKYTPKGIILNLGSGPKVINPKIINVDIFPYAGVSIVADISSLPYESRSVDAVICNTVLEHVTNPEKVIEEISRVMKPGGLVYITVPFLFPFHASPDDYKRWSASGIKNLMSEFEIVESGIRAGPFSTFCLWICYLLASIFSFGSQALYWLMVNVLMFFLFPIKILDIAGSKIPFTENISSILYAVAKKK
jgi:SAM-dependent methyltransferase